MSNIISLEEFIKHFNNIESNNSLKFKLKTNDYSFTSELYIYFRSKYINNDYRSKIDLYNDLFYQETYPYRIIGYYLKQMDDQIISDIQSKSKRCFIFDNELSLNTWKNYTNN